MIPSEKTLPTASPTWHLLVLGIAITAYVALHTLQTYYAYLTGHSLFDLAVYEQGFWNAIGNPPFFYTPEGEMSRFGRHFSPIFYVILPFYLVSPGPFVLLLIQSAAIGFGSLPLYRLAAVRFGSGFALMFALSYLMNPAIHDINVKNDFHEIAFALPCLLLLIFLSEQRSESWYYAGLLLALSTREEVAVVTAALGIYLILGARQRKRGLITLVVSMVWFVVVVGYVMPFYNTTGHFPLPDGYGYLGTTIPTVVWGALQHPDLVIHELLRAPKLAYLFWLYAPLAFISLLAPEILLIASGPLAEVLLSTSPVNYEIFERYAAPIMPLVFYAFLIGVGRLSQMLSKAKIGAMASPIMVVALVATVASQVALRKIPLPIDRELDSRTAAVLAIADMIPKNAAVVVSNHQWLAHLAHRRYLYVLSNTAPPADFIMFDRANKAITNVSPSELRESENRLMSDPTYELLRCDDGLVLLGALRNGPQNDLVVGQWVSAESHIYQFEDNLQLASLSHEVFHPGAKVVVQADWSATAFGHRDYHVFAHLVGPGGAIIAQHDGVPGGGWCPTELWTARTRIVDRHVIEVPRNSVPGRYELRVGMYDLATLRRLSVFDANGSPKGDYISIPVDMLP